MDELKKTWIKVKFKNKKRIEEKKKQSGRFLEKWIFPMFCVYYNSLNSWLMC